MYLIQTAYINDNKRGMVHDNTKMSYNCYAISVFI